MNFNQTVEYLYGLLPVYQRQGPIAYKKDLSNSLKLAAYFEQPQDAYPVIHIAGTNGKGSVSAMLAAIFAAAGYKTGLYTSPHLTCFTERFRINGKPADKTWVVNFINSHKAIIEEIIPSFFELTTLMAFQYFKEQKVDIAIIETGLGGRLDSTNITTPVLSIITNVSYDHQNLLGNEIIQIASEKAGIIKPGIPVVVGTLQKEVVRVIKQYADGISAPVILAPLTFHAHIVSETPQHLILNVSPYSVLNIHNLVYEEIKCDLKGHYQKQNIVTSLTALRTFEELCKDSFQITQEALFQGISQVQKLAGIRGRWERLIKHPQKPDLIIDVAHNPDAFSEILKHLKDLSIQKLHVILGFVKDKNYHDILSLLPTDAIYYFVTPNIFRALPSDELKSASLSYHLTGSSYTTLESAIKAVYQEADVNDYIILTGSNFLVADAIELADSGSIAYLSLV